MKIFKSLYYLENTPSFLKITIQNYIMKSFNLIMLIASLCLVLHSCKTEQRTSASLSITNAPTLDSVVNHFVEAGYYPFLYARLEDWDGNVLYEHGATNRELYPDVQMTGDTWFRVWSMSKIITISTVLDLMEDGVLSMDDPVTKYIPEFTSLQVAVAADGSPLSDVSWGNGATACPIQLVPLDSVMTVAHLINHEAGFYYATTGIPCLDTLMAAQDLPKATNTDDFINRMAQLPLIQQPGYNDFYGTNTTILGMVAERATGKSLKQLVTERVTQPLKIEGLQYGLPDGVTLLPRTSGKDGDLREAYDGELDIFGQYVPDYEPTHELYLGGEGMLGTADGYADFARMLLQRGELNGYRFLNENTIVEMSSPQTQLDNRWGYNGYNLWVTGDTIKTLGFGDSGLWTGGGYEGTHFWIDTKRKYVGVIMSQMSFMQLPDNLSINDAFRGALYEGIWKNEE